MKTFIGIEIPQSIAQSLEEQTMWLQKDYPQFNWIPPRNYHMTIHFIGDIIHDGAPDLAHHIKNELYDVKSTHLYSEGLHFFMDDDITIYVSFARNKILEDIEKRVVALLAPEIAAKKYVFVPHITIAKTRIPSKQQYLLLKKKLSRAHVEVDFPLTELTVFESVMMARHPLYKKLESVPLVLKGE